MSVYTYICVQVAVDSRDVGVEKMSQEVTFETRKANVATSACVANKANIRVKIVKGSLTSAPREEVDVTQRMALQRRLEERTMAIREGAYNRQRYGRRTEEELDDLHGKLRRKNENRESYIYISIELGKLYVTIWHEGRPIKVKTLEELHATIAYLPYVSDKFFDELIKELPNIVETWKEYDTDWQERPTAESGNSNTMMLPMRRAWINMNSDHECAINLGRLTEIEVERQIELGTIQLCKPSHTRINGQQVMDPWDEAVRKYWRRDNNRLEDMYAIERQSRTKIGPKEQVASVLLNNCGLCAESQISSLMHYVREYLLYAKQVHHIEPENEVAVLSPARWHVSLPNYTTDDPDHIFVICMRNPKTDVESNQSPENTTDVQEGINMPNRNTPGSASSSQRQTTIEAVAQSTQRNDRRPIESHSTSGPTGTPEIPPEESETWEVCD